MRAARSYRDRAQKKRDGLARVRQLADEYAELKMRVSAVEPLVKNVRRGDDLSTMLTREAELAGIAERVSDVKPVGDIKRGVEYRETVVRMTLEGVSTKQFARYLYRIMTAGYLIDVKKVRLSVGEDAGQRTLTAEMDIAELNKR